MLTSVGEYSWRAHRNTFFWCPTWSKNLGRYLLCSPSLATPYLIRGLSQVSSRFLHIGFLSTNIVSIELKKYWFYLNMIFSTKKPLITLLSFTTKVCSSLKQCFGVLNNFCLSQFSLVFYLIFRLKCNENVRKEKLCKILF